MGPHRGGRVRSEGTDVIEGSGADRLVQRQETLVIEGVGGV